MAIANFQTRYRFRSDAQVADYATPTWPVAENTTWVPSPQRLTPFRLRFEIQNTGSTTTGAVPWNLYVSRNSGAYAQVTTSTTYVQSCNAGASADNAAIATANFRLTADAGTAVAGQYDESGTTGNITLASGTRTEIEYGIQFTAAVVKGDTYDFQLRRNGAATTFTFSQTPRVTITEYYLACSVGWHSLAGGATPTSLTEQRNFPADVGAYALAIADTITFDRGLTCDPGALALSGMGAVLSPPPRHLSFTCATGSFIQSGVDQRMGRGIDFDLFHGTFALGGGAAALKASHLPLACDSGAFVLSPVAIWVTAQHKLADAVGGYMLTGVDADLRKGSALGMVAASGNYALSISDQVTRDLGLSPVAGNYDALGVAAGVIAQRQLFHGAGHYAAVGIDAALTKANARALTCATGSFIVSGIAAGFIRHLQFSIDTGLFALSGNAADREVAHALPALAGGFALSGSAAALTKHAVGERSLPISTGAYVWQIADQITIDRGLGAATGGFIYSGVAATLPHQLKITAATGSYVAFGAPSSRDISLGILPGGYALSGISATFKFAMPVAAGTHAVSGKVASLYRGHGLSAVGRAFVVGGGAADLAKHGSVSHSLPAAPGAYLWSISDQLTFSSGAPSEIGSYTVTGNAVGLSHNFTGHYTAVASTGAYLHAGSTSQRDLSLACATGIYAKTGHAIQFGNISRGTIIAAMVPITLSGRAAGFIRARHLTFAAAPGAYIAVGHVAVFARGRTLPAASSSYEVAGTPAVPRHAYSKPLDAGAYSLSGLLASMRRGRSISVATGSFTIAGSLATVKPIRRIVATPGDYLNAGVTVAFELHNSLAVAPVTGPYLISGAPIHLVAAHRMSADGGTVAVSGLPSDFSLLHGVAGNPGAYATIGRPTDLRVGRFISADAGAYAASAAETNIGGNGRLEAALGEYAALGSPVLLAAHRRIRIGHNKYELEIEHVSFEFHRPHPDMSKHVTGRSGHRVVGRGHAHVVIGQTDNEHIKGRPD